jgi:hypothetical protein
MDSSTKGAGKAKMRIIEIEFSELNDYPGLVIDHCGEENLYFTHNDKKYFCKCL